MRVIVAGVYGPRRTSECESVTRSVAFPSRGNGQTPTNTNNHKQNSQLRSNKQHQVKPHRVGAAPPDKFRFAAAWPRVALLPEFTVALIFALIRNLPRNLNLWGGAAPSHMLRFAAAWPRVAFLLEFQVSFIFALIRNMPRTSTCGVARRHPTS